MSFVVCKSDRLNSLKHEKHPAKLYKKSSIDRRFSSFSSFDHFLSEYKPETGERIDRNPKDENLTSTLIVPENNGLKITGTFLDEISHDIPIKTGVKQSVLDFRHMKAIDRYGDYDSLGV